MTNASKDGWNKVFKLLHEWHQDPPSTKSDALKRLRSFPRRMVEVNPRRESDQRNTLVYAALLGLSVISVVQLAPLTELDLPLTISVLSFAMSVPALSATVYIINVSRRSLYQYEVETLWTVAMNLAGVLFSLVGVAGLFWHLWWAAGILFILAGIAAFAIFVHYLLIFGEINAIEIAQDAGEDDQ